jgi:hypothetical protein
LFPQKSKAVRLLGPLSIAKDLDDDVWSTLTLFPTSNPESSVRIDLYSKPDQNVSQKAAEKWVWMLEQEVKAMSLNDVSGSGITAFSYECGGT